MSEQRAPYEVTHVDAAAVERALRREADRLGKLAPGEYRAPESGLVRALMKHRGWSQLDVAAVLHVDASTVRRWCAAPGRYGSEIPFAPWWLLLLRAGAVSVDDLGSPAAPSF